MIFLWCALLFAGGDSERYKQNPPKGFVDLKDWIPSIQIESRYHGSDNFTEAPLPGYGVNRAWLRKEAATALRKVQNSLRKEGLGLLMYDTYRPRRATKAMMAWAKRTQQWNLIEDGYIAQRSRHNHGIAVDLTLVNLRTGQPLDMGTKWDEFSTDSHTANATGQALKNRLKLKKAMLAEGFTPYRKEWWHFNYRLSKTRARDVPYSCFEKPEGTWKAPKNWDQPGYVPPSAWQPKDCHP